MKTTPTLQRITSARLPSQHGDFSLTLYRDEQGREHLAYVCGDLSLEPSPLVRMHSECFTGDVLGSLRCDCGHQLDEALQMIAEAGRGVLLYLRQEGRGIGLADKLRAYNLQDDGLDTVDANLMLGHPADARDYGVAAEILRDLKLGAIDLITNNPAKIEALEALGLTVRRRVPLQVKADPQASAYLATKRRRMRHLLP